VTPLEALILGCIQGLTEFLPVSSSGHLLFASRLFGLRGGFIDFAVAAHLGSLAAVLLFVRGELASMLKGMQAKAVLRLAVATLPAAAAGVLLKEVLVPYWGWQLAAAFALTALLCATIPKGGKRQWRGLGVGALLFVGAFQAAALVPGVSRSGATIWAALAAKLKRSEALNFSFLLAAIAIAGASFLRAPHITKALRLHPDSMAMLVLASFVSSLCALYLLRFLVLRLKLWLFSFYLLALAVLSAVLI